MNLSTIVSEEGFDSLLEESLDESLSALLGENLKEAIYSYWERVFFISKGEIPLKIDHFGLALEKTFGTSSPVVARCIAKRLYSKLGLGFVEKSNFVFVEYVREAMMKH